MVSMYLDRILGSKTKINTLSVLLASPERSIIENELAKEAGASVSEVNRQIRDLVNSGLVIMERVGKTKRYHANSQHFLFNPLKNVFRDLEDIYREIAGKVVKFVTEKHKIRVVILFGSLSRRRIRSDIVKEPSDIDVVVVTENRDEVKEVKKSLVEFVNSEIVPTYGIVAYPVVLSLEEYKSGLSEDAFIIDVHARGEVLYGESREDLVKWSLQN